MNGEKISKTENKTHNKKVAEIKQILLNLNLPILPLNTVRSTFYTTDIITRRYEKFIPIEFINSKGQLNFDIGGLTLIYNKDIIERSIAIISDKLWDKYSRDFKLAKLNLPPKLDMIRFNETEDYFRNLIGGGK